jgi:hypothetical protein
MEDRNYDDRSLSNQKNAGPAIPENEFSINYRIPGTEAVHTMANKVH